MFSPVPAIGFLAHAQKFAAALANGHMLAPAKTLADMHQVLANDTVDCALVSLFMGVVVLMLGAGAVSIARALADGRVSTREVGERDLPLLRT